MVKKGAGVEVTETRALDAVGVDKRIMELKALIQGLEIHIAARQIDLDFYKQELTALEANK